MTGTSGVLWIKLASWVYWLVMAIVKIHNFAEQFLHYRISVLKDTLPFIYQFCNQSHCVLPSVSPKKISDFNIDF